MSSNYLTVHEVADLLRLSPGTIKLYTKQHRLPFIRLSARVIRYDVASIHVALTQLEQPAAEHAQP